MGWVGGGGGVGEHPRFCYISGTINVTPLFVYVIVVFMNILFLLNMLLYYGSILLLYVHLFFHCYIAIILYEHMSRLLQLYWNIII